MKKEFNKEFIECVSSILYKNCQNQDIKISSKNPIEPKNIDWPNYDKNVLDILVADLNTYNWQEWQWGGSSGTSQGSFKIQNGQEIPTDYYGRNVLKCGDNFLDINGKEYFFNEEKICTDDAIKNFINIENISIFGGVSMFSIISISIITITIKILINKFKKKQ